MDNLTEFKSLEEALEYGAELRELETQLLMSKVHLAKEMHEREAERALAELWGCSTYTVRTLAAMAQFPDELIMSDVPLSVYRAAIETDDPVTWLRRAIENGWSARQLRDAADIQKGKHVSRVPLARGRAEVRAWGPDVIAVRPRNWVPSGNPPREVEVLVREVLDE